MSAFKGEAVIFAGSVASLKMTPTALSADTATPC
jgi:hypothetical protein